MKTMSILIQKNIPLKNHTTLQIGGLSQYFVEVRSFSEMKEAMDFSKQNSIPYFILGKGSNLLCTDSGYSGLVILNKIDFSHINEEEGLFHIGAGYSFSLLGVQSARKGWSGLEFASGIPGSVGGAVFMNAGANGKETADSLYSVDFLDDEGNLHCFLKQDLLFSYRTSPFQKLKGAIISATFKLTKCEEARKAQIEIVNYRTKTQPYGDKSAGCIFQNPYPNHAGKLIEEVGLKGFSIGGAKISEKHANFIINSKEASSKDVLDLIKYIKEQVYIKKNIELKSEVRILTNNKETYD